MLKTSVYFTLILDGLIKPIKAIINNANKFAQGGRYKSLYRKPGQTFTIEAPLKVIWNVKYLAMQRIHVHDLLQTIYCTICASVRVIIRSLSFVDCRPEQKHRTMV